MQKPQPKPSYRNAMPRERDPGLLGDYHLLAYNEVDSTNEEARRLAHGGGAHGAVIWAKSQTMGKGRAGREWISEAGNLYVSLLLKPNCHVETMSQLSFVAAVAARDTVAALLPEREVAVKWPNDVLVDGRKIGGILLESFAVPEQAGRWVIVGVGINVESAPEAVRFPATCLKEEGVELVSAKIVLSRFIHHFIARYNEWTRKGFAPIRRNWLSYAWGMDCDMRVSLPQEEVTGTFKGIDKDGGLVLELAPRRRRVLHAGDISLVKGREAP